MTDYADLLRPDAGQSAHAITLIDRAGFEAWLNGQPPRVRATIAAHRFTGAAGEHCIVPGEQADEWSVVAGVANPAHLSTWCLAKLAETLPEGTYRLADGGDPGSAALGWLTAHYKFERYKKDARAIGPRVLLTPAVGGLEDVVRVARAVALVRDLVNTPTADMGPAQLEEAASTFALAYGAQVQVHRGDDLETGFPMIHAVGRAASRANAPRLIELHWGSPDHPHIAIIGKGVCFDSGGLDIKPSAAMRLMKKDMGGAAHALALAKLIMASHLPVRLHLLIPAVENAIAGDAFRPGDVLNSRAGLTVEVTNTDAEGRLVLGDALTRAGEEMPELILDFATLTGAARVALGPDLPALFTNDDALADALVAQGRKLDDPLWQLPLWDGYADMMKSDIADLVNSSEGGFAGAITAAIFLDRFVPENTQWAHFDTFAWRPSAKPGRAKGGEALGLRAAWGLLNERYRPRS